MIATIAQDRGIPLEAETSPGTMANLQSLREGRPILALVQGDLAHHEWYALKDSCNFWAIASFYAENVHIFVRKPLHLQSVQQLRDKRISLGPMGSGTYFNALDILGVNGLTRNEISPSYLTPRQARDSLLVGAIDVAFITAGEFHDDIIFLHDHEDIGLLALDAQTVKTLREANAHYILSSHATRGDRKKSKGHNDEALNTIGSRACLVCSRQVPEEIVEQLLPALFHPGLPAYWGETTFKPENGRQGIADAMMHPVARKWYKEHENPWIRHLDLVRPYLWIIILVLLDAAAIRSWFYVRNSGMGSNMRAFGLVGLTTVIVVITLGVLLYVCERHVNVDFTSPIDSIWSSIVYVSSGLEDRGPVTPGGRTFAVLGIIAGAVVGGLFTATMASHGIRSLLMHLARLNGHVVVIGWSKDGSGIVRELLAWRKTVAIQADEKAEGELERSLNEMEWRRVVW